jgi:hypothetical protein
MNDALRRKFTENTYMVEQSAFRRGKFAILFRIRSPNRPWQFLPLYRDANIPQRA